MLDCIRIAKANFDNNQYPIAAIVTDKDGNIISSSLSSLRQGYDSTNHPEINAIRKASATLKQRKLYGCYLFTTLEPCPMCTSAAIWASMEGIVFGASQEDAITFVKNTPSHKLSWRQIPIPAEYIVSKGKPNMKLFGGIHREKCCELFR
jgi:tRNA(Arg) A34 adenosine deaminase TadA